MSMILLVVGWLRLTKWLMMTTGTMIPWFLSRLLSILSRRSCRRSFAYWRWRRWWWMMVRTTITSLSNICSGSGMTPFTWRLSWWRWRWWELCKILYWIKSLLSVIVSSTSCNARIIRIRIISTVVVILAYDVRQRVVSIEKVVSLRDEMNMRIEQLQNKVCRRERKRFRRRTKEESSSQILPTDCVAVGTVEQFQSDQDFAMFVQHGQKGAFVLG